MRLNIVGTYGNQCIERMERMEKKVRIGLRKALALGIAIVMAMSMTAFSLPAVAKAEGPQSAANYTGSDLWLRYVPVSDAELLAGYKNILKSIIIQENLAEDLYRFADTPLYTTAYGGNPGIRQPSNAKEVVPETRLAAARMELKRGLEGLFDTVNFPISTTATSVAADGALIVGTPETSAIIASLDLETELAGLYGPGSIGDDGYIIRSLTINGYKATVIAANTELGALYGTFAFLRLIQTRAPIDGLDVVEAPKVHRRRLNSWDLERNYASSGPNGTNGDTTGHGVVGGMSAAQTMVAANLGESGGLFNWDLAPSPSTGNTPHSNANATRLPIILDRYIIFARAAASIGINEYTLNLVNTNSAFATEYVIRQEAALADALRPYGIKVGLAINYGMPNLAVCNQAAGTYPADDTARIGTLNATMVRSDTYANWWMNKTIQILKKIPDFAGYTDKANSEGQAGPQDYGLTHHEGSYTVARKLLDMTIPVSPTTGILQPIEHVSVPVYWRSFVYNADVDNDRLARAYMEFKTGDDTKAFLPNVFVQTKNGPLDFQPREMVHPMFGRMTNTNQAVEFQVTKEYLGQNKSFCYLGTMYEEFYKFDTYAEGPGTYVGNILDGTAQGQVDTAIVGVANLGNSLNFTGHHFDQSNFYCFGRQAWDWTLTAEEIAEEWARMTWSNDEAVVEEIVDMMMGSREAVVSYQEPFGLMHQQYGTGNEHYPIMPWDYSSRDDYGPVYYNKASTVGLGWDRSVQGRLNDGLTATAPLNPLVNQYFEPNISMFSNIDTCPEELITGFQHVPWNRVMSSGNTFWEDLVYRYQMGVQYVTALKARWAALQPSIDALRWSEVNAKLGRQEADAARFRDDCIQYFGTHSMREIPTDTAPLSIKLVIGGRVYDGFNLSATVGNTSNTTNLNGSNSPTSAAYRNIEICIPTGSAFRIDEVIPYSPTAEVTITQQASAYNGVAIVTVTDRCFFGEIRQDYRFIMVRDTQLKEIKLGSQVLRGFNPSKLAYSVSVPSIPSAITATAFDPAASVSVVRPTSLPGVATITVTNSGATKTYTIRMGLAYEGNDEFNGTSLDPKWSWVRQNTTGAVTFNGSAISMPLSYGNLHVASTTATGATNQNMLLEAAPGGDWMIETKVNFASAIATANHEAGIVAYTDDRNYVAVAIRSLSATTGTVVFNVKNNISTAATSYTFSTSGTLRDPVARLSRSQVWLRIYKKGNEYMGGFSSNGVLWKSVRFYSSVGTAPPARVTLTQIPARVGIYTQTQAASGFQTNRANFDYFRVTPMGQEYSGSGFHASIEGNKAVAWYDTFDSTLSGNFLVAVYKGAAMVEVFSKEFGDDYYAEFPLDLVKYHSSEYTIKAFAWDDDYVPLAYAVELK